MAETDLQAVDNTTFDLTNGENITFDLNRSENIILDLINGDKITLDLNSDQLSTTSQIIYGSTTTFSIIVSTGCLAYIILKLRLNCYMKIILGITVGYNLLSSLINLLVLISFSINGFLTVWACRLHAYASLPLISTINMVNSISILRYVMAKLASKTKIIKDWQVISFIGATIMSSYILGDIILAFQDYSMVRSAVSMCLREDLPTQPAGPLVFGVKIAIVVALGFACDLALYVFIKKRNKVEHVGAKIIPWKSANKSETENDLHIPIRASMVSSVFMIISILLMLLIVSLTTGSNPSETFYWSASSVVIFTSCGAPVTLIFCTVKTQDKEKSKVNKSQPPQGLQFHEESESANHQSAFNRLHFHDENDDLEMGNDGIELNAIVHPLPHQCQNASEDLNLGQQIIEKNLNDVDVLY